MPLKDNTFWNNMGLWKILFNSYFWTIKVVAPQLPSPVVLGVWHEDLLAHIYLLRQTQLVTMVSKSSDGQILANLLGKFPFVVLRGSNSKSFQVLRKFLNFSELWVMALDGPKGPRRQIQPGIYWLAKQSKRPILISQVDYSCAIKLGSWDQFRIPLPFSRVQISWEYISLNHERNSSEP